MAIAQELLASIRSNRLRETNSPYKNNLGFHDIRLGSASDRGAPPVTSWTLHQPVHRTARSFKTVTMCSVNISARMQIQWINSGNQMLGFTIEFVRRGVR